MTLLLIPGNSAKAEVDAAVAALPPPPQASVPNPFGGVPPMAPPMGMGMGGFPNMPGLPPGMPPLDQQSMAR